MVVAVVVVVVIAVGHGGGATFYDVYGRAPGTAFRTGAVSTTPVHSCPQLPTIHQPTQTDDS